MDAQEPVDQSLPTYSDSTMKAFQMSKNFEALIIRSVINTEGSAFFSSLHTILIKSRFYFCVVLQFFKIFITLS